MSTVTDPAPPPTDGGSDELVDLAARVAGWARTGEDIEVYVARGDETDIAPTTGKWSR